MDQLIQAIAAALDIVESELLGASTNHGKRIAVLCALMGRELGLDEEEIKNITTCALFHDNALTEYIQYKYENIERDTNFRLHCEYGQRNIEKIPFKSDVSGFILYHHEQADGGGPFGKMEGEFPLGAELIAIADMIDVNHHLQRISPENLTAIQKEIANQSGKKYTKRAADVMLAVFNPDTLATLRDESINQTVSQLIPAWEVDVEDEAIIRLAGLATKIIDYKSPFTRKHSSQIANRAWLMGGYYGFDSEKQAKVYLAASLHDLGKLATPNAILDKPSRLTDSEFQIIKNHVKGTYDLLSGITGFEEICRWASSHHEKLDGSGYHFGKNADELDFIDRLLACTDIYQAVSEERPYHPRRSHEETMPILWDMAEKGFIDSQIVDDFNTVMALYSNIDVPPPNIYKEQGNMDNAALFKIGYGLYVLTAQDEGKDNGCIINTVMQVTSAAPLVGVITVNKQNHTHGMIVKSGKFNLSVLTTEAPFEVFKHFGFQSGALVDKFSGFEDIKRSGNGLFFLTKNTNAYLSMEVTDAIDFESHTMFKANITGGEVLGSGESVTYSYYQQNIKPKPQAAQKDGWRCNICAYVFEGDTLPEDFLCPLCKHGANDFSKI
jgi:HD-GYP domain-containing protein (c-di-GMP phosphodiesterase class II)/rubredoxin